jgi:DNA ligase (NAD+)
MPEDCPECGGPLTRAKGESARRCPNDRCPAQKIRGLIHFAGKAGLDLDGFGDKVIAQLHSQGLVREIADFYALRPEDLARLDGWGEKSAENAIRAVDDKRRVPLARFLAALGIRHVGEVMAQVLERHFPSLEALLEATVDELLTIEGMGAAAANSLHATLRDPELQATLRRLRDLGVSVVPPSRPETGGLPLRGCTFVFTGGLSRMSRSEAKERVKALGGLVASAIGRKVTHVVCGDKAGSKLDQARQLGLTLLDEEAFCRLLDLHDRQGASESHEGSPAVAASGTKPKD